MTFSWIRGDLSTHADWGHKTVVKGSYVFGTKVLLVITLIRHGVVFNPLSATIVLRASCMILNIEYVMLLIVDEIRSNCSNNLHFNSSLEPAMHTQHVKHLSHSV